MPGIRVQGSEGEFPLRVRAHLSIAVAVALVAGCQVVAGPGGKPPKATPTKTKASAGPTAGKTERLALAEERRVVDPADLTAKTKLVAAELVGKAKLISDKGLGIISNNSGALISDKGGSLIGNNGGGLVSNNGGGLISDKGLGVIGQNGAGFTLAQVGAREESLLAEAEIEVLDARGQVLVGKDGKPLGGVTGKDGSYKLSAMLPAENLILRIRLFNGGQLFAVLPRDRRTGTLDLDTASSLGTRYVLDQFVKGDQRVYDRLPGSQAAALQAEIEAARGVLGAEAPSYRPADLVSAAEALRAKDPKVGERLEAIRLLLLVGQDDLGTGLAATKVALSVPSAVVGDAAGNVYVGEVAAFRIRKVNDRGLVSVFAGTGARDAQGGIQGQTLEAIGGMAMGPDGHLYLTQTLTNQIRKIAPDGTMTPVLDAVSGSAGGLRFPCPLAVATDGTLYVGEVPNSQGVNGRVVEIRGGTITDVSPPGAGDDDGDIAFPGVAVGPDGTLYASEHRGGELWRRRPGAAWEAYARVTGLNSMSRIWLEADGAVLVSAAKAHKVVRVAPDGTVAAFAGTGEQGTAGDGGPAASAQLGTPGGLWRSPAGDLYIADGDGLVRKVAPDGTITTFAGTTGLVEGDALGLAVNGPNGLAIDREGKLVFSETGGSTIKRLDGRAITLVAGSGAGYEGDGGPAARARFASPAGIAYGPDGTLWVLDVLNRAIRKIDPAGVVSTVVADGGKATHQGRGPYPVGLGPVFQPAACAVSPTGQLYWTDAKGHQVFRLTAAGAPEVVLGTTDEAGDPDEDRPARECLTHSPLGLAFDARGDLFVLASGNSRVLRIAQGDPGSKVETWVGLTPARFFGSFLGGPKDPAAEEGAKATDVMLLGASAMCFDPAGNLYVGELGTTKLAAFGGASLDGKGLPADLLAQLPQIGTRIRRVAPDGTIRTVAGHGTRVANDPAGDDFLLYPLNMIVDREGRLIIADSALNQIKVLPKESL